MKIFKERPHAPPSEIEQGRLMRLRPYVREANAVFRPTWHIGPRRLLDYLLVQILDGNGTFVIDGTRIDVSGGDLVWIPPNTLHEMRGYAPGNQLQYVHFDLLYDPRRSHWSAVIPGGTNDLSSVCALMHPPVEDPVIAKWCGILPHGDASLVTELLRRIVLTYKPGGVSGVKIAGLMLQIIAHLTEYENEPRLSQRRQVVMEHAMRMIRLQGGRRINLDTLARQHGMSTSHFRKCFREHFGQSAKETVIEAQMSAALDYLMYSDLTISEIAEELGFSNVHNFSRAFSRQMGRPPSAFRDVNSR